MRADNLMGDFAMIICSWQCLSPFMLRGPLKWGSVTNYLCVL
jgi:hypothetical protein